MTPRDLAFWLQGFYELHDVVNVTLTAEATDLIRKHADLVLVTTPKDPFAIAVRALADNGKGLRAIVAAQFEHVIDATFPAPEKDPAHPVMPSPAWTAPAHNPHMLMRC